MRNLAAPLALLAALLLAATPATADWRDDLRACAYLLFPSSCAAPPSFSSTTAVP
jgi:hypothetical protein